MLGGYLVPKQIAIWNSVRGVWEKPGMVNLLCEHWGLFSETWPTSGTMRNGVAYQRLMPVRPTTGSEFLLLRTPAASEAERGHQPEDKARARGGQVTLSGQTNFGGNFDRFEPAVRRWEEVTGNDAPSPTKPDGRDGVPRLSSKFTEWMMGLPNGWVTGLGLSRKDELKACGNGVVPQQAALALSMLLDENR